MKTTTLMRAGKIVHPSDRVTSGYCVNNFVTNSGDRGVVFASEITKASKDNKGYLRTYHYDFVCNGVGIFITKLPKGYMVAVNTPSCVTMLLCSEYGIGIAACVHYAGDPRNVSELHLDDTTTDVIYMDKFEDAITSMDTEVVETLKETIDDELKIYIKRCLDMNTPPCIDKYMWDNKVNIVNDTLSQIAI